MCPPEPSIYADDHYQVLGLSRGATDKDIGAAFKRLALKYHPDKNPNNRNQAELDFKRISQSYDILRDPAKRRSYDESRQHLLGCGDIGTVQGDLGSVERAEELYQKFFQGHHGGSGKSIHIDVAGIFNFGPAPGSLTSQSKVPDKGSPAHVVSIGTSVVIHGLTSKTEHNGKSATVHEWNGQKRRYEVKLTCGDIISLRPHNITQLGNVRVAGHENHHELNGHVGEIVDFNRESGCYVLLMEDPAQVLELPPKNCILSVGTAAILQGLSDEQLSGLLVLSDLTDSNSTWAVAVRLLDSTGLRRRLPCGLGGELLARGLATGGLASGLLCELEGSLERAPQRAWSALRALVVCCEGSLERTLVVCFVHGLLRGLPSVVGFVTLSRRQT